MEDIQVEVSDIAQGFLMQINELSQKLAIASGQIAALQRMLAEKEENNGGDTV